MYRDRSKQCPGCRSLTLQRLLAVDGVQVTVDVCEACGGAFFDFSAGTPGRLASQLLVNWPVVTPRRRLDERKEVVCRRCERPMLQHPRLRAVFACRACGAVFAPPTGLAVLAGTYVADER